MPIQEQSVVVGVDGTQSAHTAAMWAAAEAARRHLPLRLVYAYTAPSMFYPWSHGTDALDREARSGATRMVEELAEEIRSSHTLHVAGKVRAGHPVDVLREESQTAVLTVVGPHGSQQFAEALLGSVAARIAGRAASPLVVVRTTDPDTPPRLTGPVVVGVDHVAHDDAALVFAFDEARRCAAPLVAVHSWNEQGLRDASTWLPFTVTLTGIEGAARQRLHDLIEPWASAYPDVDVREVVSTHHPAATLLGLADSAAAEPARMLVVGRRGSGGFRRLLLGSVSSSLIAYAPCPVVVVNDHVQLQHDTVE